MIDWVAFVDDVEQVFTIKACCFSCCVLPSCNTTFAVLCFVLQWPMAPSNEPCAGTRCSRNQPLGQPASINQIWMACTSRQRICARCDMAGSSQACAVQGLEKNPLLEVPLEPAGLLDKTRYSVCARTLDAASEARLQVRSS